MDKKTALRDYSKILRKTLNLADISKKLVEKIRNCPQYKNAQNVMIYYPAKCEINFLELMQDDKNFYLPRVAGKNLQVCPYKSGDNLNKSKFGILEPITKEISPAGLDLIIVPALMADCKGYRLGYGGGYYDRFLAEINDNSANISYPRTLCALPKQLVVDKFPHDDFDIPVDIVLTD